MSDPQAELQRVLGDSYTLERELGRGGMGTVFLARDTRLHRPVAIKLLPPEMATNADLRERFLRETRLAASFSHPNIVPVHGVEERGNLLAFVMGFVDGETLGARVRRGGPLTVPEAVRTLQEVAWALSYAHGRGIVHRDIKPDNILLERSTGRALVTDFGIARTTAAAAPGEGLTRVGEIVGTPQFMSPEQASGDLVDGRSDLYSLGIVAFFVLAGKLPFDAPTPTGLLAMHLTQAPPSLAALRPDVPLEMVAAVERCLAKRPDDRFGSGEELATVLDGMRRSTPEVAPAVRVFLQRFGTAMNVCIGFGGLIWWTIASNRNQARANLDWILLTVVMLAGMWGIMVQAHARVRSLIRQGFRYRDVQAAVGTIRGEDIAARDAIRASSDDMRRRQRRLRVGIFLVAWAPLAFWWVATRMRHEMAGQPGRHAIGVAGVILATAAAVALGLGLTLLGSDPLKANPFVFVQALFWRGPLGRLVFRIGAWGVPHTGDVTTPGVTSVRVAAGGPLTLLLSLSKTLRRGLGDVERQLAALERGTRELTRREAELAAAVSEATVPPVGGTELPAISQRRLDVAGELAELIGALRHEREAKQLRLENVRLELLRLRAGIGTADAVRRALES